MKLLAFLKVTLKGIIRELPIFLLSYAVYPLVIALVMSFAQQDMFTPVINNPIFSIIIVDEDETPSSKNLVSFLTNEEVSKVITVITDEDEDFDYTLRIPVNYENSLLGQNSVSVTVEAEEKASSSKGNLLVNIVDKYNSELSQGLVIQNSIMNPSLSKKQQEILALEINEMFSEIYNSNSIESNIHKVRKGLNSYEYYSITFLSFIFVIFIMAIINSDAAWKEVGLNSRIMSTSITKYQYFNYNLMSNYLTIIVANLFYVFAYRFSGLSFKGSLPLLLLIILVQSFMITTIGTLISTLFKKGIAQALLQIFLIYNLIFGGMIGPLDKMAGNRIFVILARYKPDILISNTYKNYLLNNNISSISNYLLIIVGISFGLYLFNILIVHMKRGVSR